MVAYNTDIPNAPNNPSVDQPKMKENTNSINTLISVDHIGFNATDGGYHTVIHQKPTSDPGIVATVGQLYVKTANSDQNLFFRSGVGTISQLTGLPATFAASGSAALPGGLIIKWGTGTTSNGGTVNNFLSAFTTNCYSVVPTQSTAGAIIIQSLTVNGFTAFRSGSGSSNFTYIAVGN